METYKSISFVFLLFCIISVHTAPRDNKIIHVGHSKILFSDESNHNLDSTKDIQKLTNLLSRGQNQQPKLQESNKLTQAIYETNNVKLFNRFPHMDDVRQNWGILVNGTTIEEDEEQYKRPIKIPMPSTDNPIKPQINTAIMKSQATPLLTAQVSPISEVSGTSKFTFTSGLKKKKQTKLISCDIARVVCCIRNYNLHQCFTSHNCYMKVIPTTICGITEIQVFLKKLKDWIHETNSIM